MLQIVNYAESYRNQNIYQLKGFYKLEAKKKYWWMGPIEHKREFLKSDRALIQHH
jgi:hypothetical protein